MQRKEKCAQNFGWKTSKEKPGGRPRCKWEDNTEMGVIGVGCNDVTEETSSRPFF